MPARTTQYDAAWRRANLAALLMLSVTAGAAMGGWAIHRRPCAGASLPVDAARAQAAAEKIDPNVASAGSLRRLPGIGPVKAQAIMDHRQGIRAAPFVRAKDLCAVRGIGPATTARIKPYLTLEDP